MVKRSKTGRISRNRIARFQKRILSWAIENGRHHFQWRSEATSVYEKVLAETLLQRTRAETVAAFLDQFLRRFPNWQKLASARERELQRSLRPIGLWRRRAQSLRKLAAAMVLRKGEFPQSREEVGGVAGVGQYLANAILTICHGECQPLLDVNMARVLERYFGPRALADIRYDPYLQNLALRVVSIEQPSSMNWALLDFGALVCKPRGPLCRDCPVARGCHFLKAQHLSRH